MAWHFSCRRMPRSDCELLQKVPRQLTWRGTFVGGANPCSHINDMAHHTPRVVFHFRAGFSTGNADLRPDGARTSTHSSDQGRVGLAVLHVAILPILPGRLRRLLGAPLAAWPSPAALGCEHL